MELYMFLYFSLITVAKAVDGVVECPCPKGYKNDECTKQPICVYGINEDGKIFHNGKNDVWQLTKIALQRKSEINKVDDDILVNLYNPFDTSWVIFYYGCQECNDLKQIQNLTVSNLRIFLLSLYNQRMKYNIKYAQSDFKSFSDNLNEQQPMPVITVRPFWKDRLMLNQTCAHQQHGFTQKHFIPAFLTQDICILDYKYVEYQNQPIENRIFQTKDGQIIYSATLSSNDLYSSDILINSTKELPIIHDGLQLCKAAFLFQNGSRLMRYFCLCDKSFCTLKVAQKDPIHFCPYGLAFKIYPKVVYKDLHRTSNYMDVDNFFLEKNNADKPCFFVWRVNGTQYNAYIRNDDNATGIPMGYTIKFPKPKWFCQSRKMSKKEIEPFNLRIYKSDTWELRDSFVSALTDHSKIQDDIEPVGANCTMEGPLSHSLFSSGYGSNTSMFPCYKYFDIDSLSKIFPIIGINMLPITVAKGEECYYYTMKKDNDHFKKGCGKSPGVTFPPIMGIIACPEKSTYNVEEFQRFKDIFRACPSMNSSETKWKFIPSKTGICGQFIRGLKVENGVYIPKEIEFRETTKEDFEMTGMLNALIEHGCGFNSSQQLTLCTCYAIAGGCDNLYTAGRVHVLRYLPFKNTTV